MDMDKLLQEKKHLESKLFELNERIYNSCSHKWTIDYIENGFTYQTIRVEYCEYCELNRR